MFLNGFFYCRTMFVFIFLCLLSSILLPSAHSENATALGCSEVGDCITSNTECENKCGCDSAAAVLFYNETIDECVVNVKKLLLQLEERYNTQEKIRLEVDKVFQGIMLSVILFVTCASLCVVTACIYCFRINYIDNRLKSDIEALANKLKRDCRFKKSMKAPVQPAAESCNIIVEDAGVFVV